MATIEQASAERFTRREVALSKADKLPLFPLQNRNGGILTLADDLKGFEDQISQSRKVFLLYSKKVVGIFGLPGSGKNWLQEEVVEPYLGNPRVVEFDESAAELRRWQPPIVKTPRGKPLEAFELKASRVRTVVKTVNGIRDGYVNNVIQGPAGTALQYGVEKSEFYSTREYMDSALLEFISLLSRKAPGEVEEVWFYLINIVRGPNMDLWDWRRQFLQDSTNIEEGNYINWVYGLEPFKTEEEYQHSRRGGSIVQMENAQRLAWATSQLAISKEENLPPNFTYALKDDIANVADIMKINPRRYYIRTQNNLASYFVYERNFYWTKDFFKQDQLLRKLRWVVVLNNPSVKFCTDEQREALIELIDKGKKRYQAQFDKYGIKY